MKKLLLFVAILLIQTISLYAQVVAGARHVSLNSDNWKYVLDEIGTTENAIFTSGFSVDLGYEFPLIRFRVTSIAPVFGYTGFRHQMLHPNSGQSVEFALTSPSLEVFVIHYPFDNQSRAFGATKLKTAPVFRKGFFVAAGAGFMNVNTTLEYQQLNLATNQYNTVKGDYTQTAWNLAFKTGFDIGISRFLTISPGIGVSWMPGLKTTDFFIPARGVTSNSIFLTVDEDVTRSALAFAAGLSVKVHFINVRE